MFGNQFDIPLSRVEDIKNTPEYLQFGQLLKQKYDDLIYRNRAIGGKRRTNKKVVRANHANTGEKRANIKRDNFTYSPADLFTPEFKWLIVNASIEHEITKLLFTTLLPFSFIAI